MKVPEQIQNGEKSNGCHEDRENQNCSRKLITLSYKEGKNLKTEQADNTRFREKNSMNFFITIELRLLKVRF